MSDKAADSDCFQPQLDWSQYESAGFGDPYADVPKQGGEFAKAISVCINSLQCLRPIERGVMCPSFRVTQDAKQSPGGRVKLLKEILNANDPHSLARRGDVVEAMSSCVSCNGCKRECDSNVDMASIKAEYLQQFGAEPGIRERFFAAMPLILNDYRPALKWATQLRNAFPLVGRLSESLFGINPHRRLPSLAPRAFFKGGNTARTTPAPLKQAKAFDTVSAGKVFLLVDTFKNHYEPEVVEAALRVLDALGYEPVTTVPSLKRNDRPLCCGRTYFSSGQLDAAKSEASRTLKALAPIIAADMPIVGLEPSCLVMLRDEYLSMGLAEQAEGLAKRALLFEEFLAKEIAAGKLQKAIHAKEFMPPVLVHGHCHQKSVGAMKSVRKVLSQVDGLQFQFIESSCCGGAGSFAFQKEHAALAEAMAELALAPAVREAPNAIILSNGFSCREQIRHHTGRKSLHLSELLDICLN